MNELPPSAPAGTRLIRRLLPLAILASAVALVVVQLTGSITHEITLQLELEPQLASGLNGLDLQVIDPDGQTVSVTQFRFDAEHRPPATLTHTLQLVDGSYQLIFELRDRGPRPSIVRRELAVDGDAAVRFRLP